MNTGCELCTRTVGLWSYSVAFLTGHVFLHTVASEWNKKRLSRGITHNTARWVFSRALEGISLFGKLSDFALAEFLI